MATPYFQVRLDTVASTQDEAKSRLGAIPVSVSARSQSAGRGRSGAEWVNADRTVAVSVATRLSADDRRPVSLMAGVAATRVVRNADLKWPNDIMLGELKVGGVLVERSEDLIVIGIGLNLWWSRPPEGMGSLLSDDPGDAETTKIASMWTAEMMRLLDRDGWPVDEYRSRCKTFGRDIAWQPDGHGTAVDVAEDGGLVVLVRGAEQVLYSGAVRHVRG